MVDWEFKPKHSGSIIQTLNHVAMVPVKVTAMSQKKCHNPFFSNILCLLYVWVQKTRSWAIMDTFLRSDSFSPHLPLNRLQNKENYQR